ncbi:type II secretion system secretin GspD [Cupriavidus taiwanensis]|uniref:type II secretion system secretin GspD n=1 Tax=Cupriavidus taiwanensis TaxID=164546 RepID=UPI000E1066E0|nr:type II secretion system secretin GspD [Cupriavidus taiwanensis]SOY52602.1 General Secretory Pathway protein D, type II secretion system [Cupriavidus taiwanensis]SOY85610.1 General Secretory Pathway protein D, type II secretion system [Cupriavidus taiwanensis]SPA15561.1 General Secretory Pathway protein D, type II secretion system [Cupriavidus taiwanensis]SPD44802.1 General Secretory Pathway protein D, type II secretion system [Cupriavidus taiwanensis]
MTTHANRPVFKTACARAVALLCGLSLLAPAPLWAQPGAPAARSQGTPPAPPDVTPANRDQVVLNFVNADLDSVIKAVGQATGKNFVIDPRVKGTVNLVTEQPVSRAQALQTLGSVLRMQGYAMVESNGFTKVVPEADAKLQGSPTVIGGAPSRGDQVVTQVFRLNYESANNLVPVLRPMIAPNNTITAYPANNTLVITDYADNLRRIARIIAAVDAPASGEVELVPLKHALASDTAAVLQKLLDPAAAGATSGGAPGLDASLRTSVVAEPRSNALMIRATSRARLQQARHLIEKLDQPYARPGNIWVVPLKNADAIKLAATLRAIVAADSSFATTTQPGAQAGGIGGAAGMTNVSTPTGGQFTGGATTTQTGMRSGTGTGGGTGGAYGSSAFAASFGTNTQPTTGGIIQADPSTNSLIITASEPVYRNLRGVIDDLDARRAQVYIESMIVEVTATQASELGIQWQGLISSSSGNNNVFAGTNFGTGGQNILNLTLAGALADSNRSAGILAAQQLVPDIGGLNLGIVNRAMGLGALLRALGTNGSVNLLSTPNLITLENEEAKILIGQNIPITTGSYAQTGGAASVTPFQTFDRKDVGITLRVKPQITDGGLVKMQIFQESSNVVQATANLIQGPTTNVRSIETNVLVDDGQIIVLGGLIEDSYGDGVQKVPLLGDIPWIGGLFRYENKNRSKTNLLVFLRPYVMRTSGAADRLTQDRYDYMRAQQQSYVSPNIMMRDTNTPMLPPADAPTAPFVDPRANGPVAGPMPLPQTLPQGAPQQPGLPQPLQQVPQQVPQAPQPPVSAPQPLNQRGESALPY